MNVIQKNDEFPISDYLTRKANAKRIPLHGAFELTARCNFNCKMCYVHGQGEMAEQKKRELSTGEWLQIAEEAKEQGLLILLLTGGEVFLREDFSELYSKLAVMGFRMAVNTNGSLLRKEVLDCFRKNPPGRVTITLYGSSEDTYESLCGSLSAHRVMESVHELKKAGISVRTNFSLTSLNCQDMKAVYEFSRKEGTLIDIGCYMFPQIRVNGGAYGENQGRMSPEDAGCYQVKAEHLCLSEEDFTKRAKWMLRECRTDPGQDKKGYPIQCQAGRSSFWITWNGKMRPCGLMTEPEADVRREGFSAAWKRVHQMAAEIRLPYECRLCANRNLCRVCAGKCVAETGRFDQKPEYVCRMASAMRRAYGEGMTK